MTEIDILILGAGCAGTSLAHYLEQAGYDGSVALVDGRTSFDQEQRWCSWADLPASLLSLVEHSWREWGICDEKRLVVRSSEKFTYRQIYAPHFFQKFHSPWRDPKTATNLHLGEFVQKIQPRDGAVEVATNSRRWRAQLVFDARHAGGLVKNQKIVSSVHLHQTFLGWTVKYPHPVFNTKTAIIMDFRTAQIDGVNFIYVLPYSETEALVESTAFNSSPARWETHLLAVTRYLEQNFGAGYEIKAEESGALPMMTRSLPTKLHPRIYAIGVAGGAARPSSGYAFHRIQRQTAALARTIVDGETLPTKVAANKYNLLDAIFLEALERRPAAAQEIFTALFERVAPDALIRFLLDESSWRDDLAVVGALPKLQFGIAGWQHLQRKLVGRDERRQTENNYSLSDSVGDSVSRIWARNLGG